MKRSLDVVEGMQFDRGYPLATTSSRIRSAWKRVRNASS
jgi:hypothetical protein